MSLAAPPLQPVPSQFSVDIAVVGAGLVGLTTALVLSSRGHHVAVFEREGIAAGPSRGNAGAYAYSDIFPLASPGILAKVPGWLLDPLGPLALRPSYLPKLAPWLWKFWKASRPDRFAQNVKAQVALNTLAASATGRVLKLARAEHLLRCEGNLHLYEGKAAWHRASAEWDARAAHGIAFEHLHGIDAIAAKQPGLSPSLTAATFVRGWHSVDDPYALCCAMATELTARGVAIYGSDVKGLAREAEAITLRGASHSVRAKRVVVAAGAWSHHLTATLGERIPLETERGYNTTLPPGAFDLRRQLTFPDHGFVMTPIAGRVRVGGAVELAGLDAQPNFARSRAMLNKAHRFVPGLKTVGGTPWMGCRPSLPDSLPAIGPLASEPRVLCAFGHGHLGLTQSGATAELIADLIEGKPPQIDLAAFAPGRFG